MSDSATTEASRDPRDIVTPDAFRVAPGLIGLPLARPGSRLAAMLIDLLAIALLSQSGSFGFALAAALLGYGLARGRRDAAARPGRRVWAVLLALLLGAGVLAVGRIGSQLESADVPDKEVAAALAEVEALGDDPERSALQERIRALEKENAELRSASAPVSPLALGERLLDDVGFGFGWAAVYFSVLPAWWRGQTLGKRALGLRLLRLNGQPLTVWNAFDRYGGYAAGFATGLLGFLQVFWDANRQAIHDRICGTVVVDERRRARASTAAD